jgi:hypothetical protein
MIIKMGLEYYIKKEKVFMKAIGKKIKNLVEE